MVLYFLRHGQAGHDFPTDFERELTEEGKHASKIVGKFCSELHIHLTHAFASPLVRAQQTAHAVLKKLPEITLSESEHLTPDADPRNLLELLRTLPNDSRVLLVTHEPFVTACISKLISGSEATHVIMKTTSLACIETHGSLVKGCGKLRWLLTPDIMEKSV
ncbi:MAG: phosphohistidine phosphatase SixA [Bacteroidota bacterium]|jgi:phosphohistidine phosphatase